MLLTNSLRIGRVNRKRSFRERVLIAKQFVTFEGRINIEGINQSFGTLIYRNKDMSKDNVHIVAYTYDKRG